MDDNFKNDEDMVPRREADMYTSVDVLGTIVSPEGTYLSSSSFGAYQSPTTRHSRD